MTDLSSETLPALVDRAKQAIETAGSFEEVKAVRDHAEALRAYARHINAGLDAQNACAEIKLRAERRMGQELRKLDGMGSHGGDRKSSPAVRLDAIGINKNQSSRWQRVASLADEEFEDYVADARARGGEITTAGVIKLATQTSKADERASKMAALAEATQRASEQIGLQQYGLIVIDPPWQFEPYSRETGMDRAADNHYPTMSLQAIFDLDVPDAAASDCVLFLWATAPLLDVAVDLLRSWGFTYKSNLVWVKPRIGTGYWARNRHEHLLIGVRGGIPAPLPGTQPDSVQEWPTTIHSAKPDGIMDLITALYPDVPKLEMFARGPRAGWDTWGNEADADASPA